MILDQLLKDSMLMGKKVHTSRIHKELLSSVERQHSHAIKTLSISLIKATRFRKCIAVCICQCFCVIQCGVSWQATKSEAKREVIKAIFIDWSSEELCMWRIVVLTDQNSESFVVQQTEVIPPMRQNWVVLPKRDMPVGACRQGSQCSRARRRQDVVPVKLEFRVYL